MEKLRGCLHFISLGKYHTVFHSTQLKSSIRASVAGGIASIILFIGLLVIGVFTFIDIFGKINRNVQIRTRELNAYKYNLTNNFMSSEMV